MIMLDTNICIYILKERPQAVKERFDSISEVHLSSIVYAELCFGIELSPRKIQAERSAQLDDFMQLVTVQTWDEQAAEQYAKLRGYLKAKGMLIGNMDLLIAAHALSLGATLVSNNTHEFERVPDLCLENWVDR